MAGAGPIHENGVIERVIAWSAHNRFLTIFITLLIAAGGWYSTRQIPLDAIPDLSDTQVVIFVQWMGRDPQLIEDQITYPIITSLIAAPNVRVVRGFSDFSMAYIYVIFEDGTDIYWARSRVLEYLSKIQGQLPQDADLQLGPDATGVGWVFQYALVDTSGENDLAELRTYQDWTLRYALESVEGVAEVAPIGGFVRSYQVEIDPNALAARGLSIDLVTDRIRKSNRDVGGRVMELAGMEYIIRGRGYVEKVEDLANISLGATPEGTPIRVADIGRVVLGPDMRRGVAELDGKGEVVGGVVVIRYGENALSVIDAVKKRLDELKATLPEGVQLVTVYDRSDLILKSIETLNHTLMEEMVVVSIVILIFLMHLPSAFVPIITIPFAVLISFIPMWYFGISSNIMSLGGIAVAIGALVDGAIVVVENVHKRLEEWESGGRVENEEKVVIQAVQEVGRPTFFSLLVIAVSFLPVFALTGQEGKLFRPLALTKNLSMFFAAFLAITLDPALRLIVTRHKDFTFRPRFLSRFVTMIFVGKIRKEEEHPISRALHRLYEPVCRMVLEWPKSVIALAIMAVIVSIPIYFRLGSEFMPSLWEGSFLYMPSSSRPGASVTTASNVLRAQDRMIAAHPAVKSVFGKIGRAVSATDPAPLTMVETTIQLKEESEWPFIHDARWWSGKVPGFMEPMMRSVWPDERRMDWKEVRAELDVASRIPGWPNIWTMPIENRINMLSTGIRAPVGIKIYGEDLATLDELANRISEVVRKVPGATSVVTEPLLGAPYVEIVVKREEAARYGLSIEDVNMAIETVIGGMTLTTTVEGRERYPVQLRYPRELRDDPEKLKRVLIPIMARGAANAADGGGSGMATAISTSGMAGAPAAGAQIPLEQLADIRITSGPAMIKDEDGALAAYINIDFAQRDLGTFVEDARAAVQSEIIDSGVLPPGYRIGWSGQYEFQLRAAERLKILVPITILLVFFLLYMNTGSFTKTMIVLVAVPFSAIGAVWLLWALDYNISVAVWVGLIALLGLDAETAIFMLLFLDLSYEKAKQDGKMRSLDELKEAIVHGAVMRVRPKFMTVATTFIGLVPILWATGTGADVMKRIAAPMVGGLFTSFAMELIVYPAIYLVWKWRTEVRHA